MVAYFYLIFDQNQVKNAIIANCFYYYTNRVTICSTGDPCDFVKENKFDPGQISLTILIHIYSIQFTHACIQGIAT